MSDINRFIPFVKWLDSTSRPTITACITYVCIVPLLLNPSISFPIFFVQQFLSKQEKEKEIYSSIEFSLPSILFPCSNILQHSPDGGHTVWDNLFANGTRKQQETVDKGRRINPLNGAGSSCI